MQEPVAQSDVPVPQSAPSTQQKSSEKIQDNDGGNRDDDDEEDEEEEEDGLSKPRKKFKRTRREWTLLGRWDRTEKLDSEINAEILQLATEEMSKSGLVEWPVVEKDASKMKCIGLWAQHAGHYSSTS